MYFGRKEYFSVKTSRKATPFTLKFPFIFLSSVQFFSEKPGYHLLLTIVKMASIPFLDFMFKEIYVANKHGMILCASKKLGVSN